MHYDTIDVISRKIRDRQVSPVDVVESCLRQIEVLNPKLNAFVSVMADAREHARAAEVEINAGGWRGPLHGIPVGIKDFYDTAGHRTTAGTRQFSDWIPEVDAEVVKLLKRAGAIIVGKTNMDALGMATSGQTSFFGPVRNPWNADHVTGGSSSGSACAVATGMCFATVDTDAVGSVRIPAACCGVVGFKPSYDLISLKGILGDAEVDEFIRWMGHAGITARSALDTALLLNVLADRTGYNFVTDLACGDLSIRVGIGSNVTVTREVRREFDKAVTLLSTLGYEIKSATVPFGDPSQGSMSTIERDRASIAGEAFSEVDVIMLPTLEAAVPAVAALSAQGDQGVSAENTAFANYYGLPAVSVPGGLDDHGLPVGIQIVGRPGHDSQVLSIAYRYQQAAPFKARTFG